MCEGDNTFLESQSGLNIHFSDYIYNVIALMTDNKIRPIEEHGLYASYQ